MKQTNKFLLASLICGPALMLGGCSDSDSGSDAGDRVIEAGLPEGLNLSMLSASDGRFFGYDTTSGQRTDMNARAAASQDSAVQNLQITDTAAIGHILHWPYTEEEHAHAAGAKQNEHAHEEGEVELRFLLMRPDYQPGSPIDADSFFLLADFHGDELAGHSAEEYRNPEPGSNIAEELERLNAFVMEQAELEAEVGEAMEALGQTLCRAYVDPFIQAELAHAHEAGSGDAPQKQGEPHAEHGGELVHYALSDTGRLYFFEEHEGALESLQGFVKLDDTSSILDCSRTTIARASEDGVLVFIPDTQKLYLVDAHDGADFHQHSTWSLTELAPSGMRVDLVAILGEGEAHAQVQ